MLQFNVCGVVFRDFFLFIFLLLSDLTLTYIYIYLFIYLFIYFWLEHASHEGNTVVALTLFYVTATLLTSQEKTKTQKRSNSNSKHDRHFQNKYS
jgi:hypothetical protein